MAITNDDIAIYLTGGANNTDPNSSLGGAVSNTQVSMTELFNIFDRVDGEGSTDGETNYRIVAIRNNASQTATRAKVFFGNHPDDTDPVNYDGNVALGTREAVNVAAPVLADENTAPNPEVTFTKPTTRADAIALGDIPAGEFIVLYLRRVIAPGSPLKDDATFSIQVNVDTGE